MLENATKLESEYFTLGVKYALMYAINATEAQKIDNDKKNAVITCINEEIETAVYKLKTMFNWVKEHNQVPDFDMLLKAAEAAPQLKKVKEQKKELLETMFSAYKGVK